MNLTHFAVLYAVHLEPVYAIPIVYLVAFIAGRLLREFVHGWIKYVLAVLFAVTFAVLCFILMLDYSPWQIIMPVFVLGGISAGLWRLVGETFRAIKKV